MAEQFTRRPKSAWGEGGQLKGEILDVAERMLADAESESALSLRAVAREVGISAPSIYLHFADRTALVDAVTERVYHQIAAEMRAARLAVTDDAAQALVAMGQRYCSFVSSERATQRLLFSLQRPAGLERLDSDHPITAIHREWREAVAAVFPDRGAAEVHQTALLMWVSMHGLMSLTLAFPSEVSADEITSTIDTLLRQLLNA